VLELIPHIETAFRAVGGPTARTLEGESTGGWAALALQAFYPNEFNGAWAFCPDSVDFRAFQRTNIYSDENIYMDQTGLDQPSARSSAGKTLFTVRREVALERALGYSSLLSMSGEQWGAWTATFGPKGADGLPVPLWDVNSGRIVRDVAQHWRRFDLNAVLSSRWSTVGARLADRLHVWVGDRDSYFLNEAVGLLAQSLALHRPRFQGTVTFGPGKGHCWPGLDALDTGDAMARATGATP
jgi:hypothetical protein